MIVHISSQHRAQGPAEGQSSTTTGGYLSHPEASVQASSSLPVPPGKLDLRRNDKRAIAELVVARAAHLPDADRTLLTMVFAKDMKVSELAQAGDLDARASRRRVRSLVARVLNPRFAYVLARRESWPASRRRVATACLVEGQTLRQAAASLRMSLYRVRELRNAIEHGYEESKGLRKALGGAA